jgi:eukaryotic-like serine/threonine-protein kinase
VLSSAHSVIGSSLENEHRSSEAIEHFRASLAMLERLLGPAHPTVARGVLNVGLAELSLHRYRDALESLERSMATFRAAGLDHGNDWLVVLPNMASTECELDDTEAGLRFASEALAAASKEDPQEDVREDVVGAYGVTGDCLLRAKRYGPARDAYASGLAALRAGEVSPGDVEHENELETGLGTVELETGRAGDAARRFERIARAQRAAGDAADPEQVAEVSFKLARALALLHREPERARSLAEDARRVYGGESSPEEAKLAEIDAFLAAETSGER